MRQLYIGLMSGTSTDGIDAALVDFSDNRINLVGFTYLQFTDAIKNGIQQLSSANNLISLQQYGELDAQLGHLFAQAANTLLNNSGIHPSAITAIGSHGQTVYHAPDSQFPFSLQIGDPNIIAEITGITTVADFRRRDIACSGQGAPLVPAFHLAAFGNPTQNRCIINIGGIANITVLPALDQEAASVTGFDTGPGNTMMDQWVFKHHGLHYDQNGNWAQSGKINPGLVGLLKNDCYFRMPPPKSTGKEYFSLAWLEEKIADTVYPMADIQASLCFLTADTICDAIRKHAPDTELALICGGGIHNNYLLRLINERLPCPSASTADYGIHPDHVEAMAFAWLAKQTISMLPGNLMAATGAKRAAVLGGIYPAISATK